MSIEDHIRTLECLGLTKNQAKVYLALSSEKYFTVKELQKNSGVPRQEIYMVLSKLEEIGVTEKTIGRPIRFKGVPIKRGVTFLLKQKKKETKKIEKMAKEMTEKYVYINNNKNGLEIKPHFVLLSKMEASNSKRCEEIDDAKISIDFITSWKRFPCTIHTLGENGIEALNRGVKMRVILEKPNHLNEVPTLVEEMKVFPNYELRYILKNPKAIIGIFDKKHAIVKTAATVELGEKASLWTDNQCFLSIISDYFEAIWATAREEIPEEIVSNNKKIENSENPIL